jgi:hypothetical protein
MEAEE